MGMKNCFRRIGHWFSAHRPTKRRLIQLYAALLFNANLKGFSTGRIYKGPVKNLCTPGLNCYSCPGASGACPLGALQNSLAESGARAPYYVFGIIMLYGLLFGRMICGWLCPFGLIQELLHKIPTPKLKKNRFTRVLSFLKYVILVVFVLILPLAYMLRDFPLPAFCKYICPAGTLGGAMGLLANEVNASYFHMLGPLFTWKFVLMVSILVGAIFIYRIFCRFLCPLGALYGLFNRFSLLGVRLDRPKCVDCGRCVAHCKMDIHHVGDAECISCGACISVCPTNAISFKGGQILLPPNEVGDASEDADKAREKAKKLARRRTAVRVTAAILAAVLLGSALVYYNVIDKPDAAATDSEFAPIYEMPLYGTDGVFSVEDTRGRVTVLNFWGVWCGPCKEELPHFSQLAADLADGVTVVAIHTDYQSEAMPAYIEEHFKDSAMLFCTDGANDDYYLALGGGGTYPMTVVLDRDGRITETFVSKVDYDTLHDAVMRAMLKG